MQATLSIRTIMASTLLTYEAFRSMRFYRDILFVLCIIFGIIFFPSEAGAQVHELSWRFNTQMDISEWKISGAYAQNIDEAGLLIEGIAPTMSISGIDSDSKLQVLKIRLKSHDNAQFIVEAISGTRKISKSIELEGVWESGEYVVNLSELPDGKEKIDSLVLRLPSNQPIYIETVSLERLSVPMLMKLWWEEFWIVDIGTQGINFIRSPTMAGISLISLFYVLIFTITLIAYAWLMIKKHENKYEMFLKTIFLSFIVSGTLFSLRMDYNWFRMWQGDFHLLAGMEVEERIKAVHGDRLDDFLDFIKYIKEKIPEGEKITPAIKGKTDYLAVLAKYYLLPELKISERGRFFWVFNDNVSYNPAEQCLYQGEHKILYPVRLVSAYKNNAAIFELLR